jgi:hypothetical protein
MKTLYMETTHIAAEQTVTEIQRVLGIYGAAAIRTDYENKEVTSVSFLLKIGAQEIPFKLPCRWEPIFNHLQKKRIRRRKKEDDDRAQSKRIAWRQILRWVEAQLALVDTEMVSMQEVFMPYIQIGKGKTLYEHLIETKFKMLEHKGD